LQEKIHRVKMGKSVSSAQCPVCDNPGTRTPILYDHCESFVSPELIVRSSTIEALLGNAPYKSG
jgi:hypothetical protein